MKQRILLLGMWLTCCMSLFAQSVTEMEYFFDTDPGFGNGTSLAISSADTIDVTTTISTNMLSPGIHHLYVRAKNQNGEWSLYHKGTFQIEDSTLQSAANDLTEIEYFVDTDPGVGNGTSISFSATDTTDLLSTLSIAGLAPGPHQFCFRAKDQMGKWGLYQCRIFWVLDSVFEGEAPQLSRAEYFFDTDPGIGNGTSIAASLTDTLDVLAQVSTSGLSVGIHRLYLREQNADQTWGLYHGGLVYVGDSTESGEAPQLVGLEYFYGPDPGTCNGNYVPFAPTDSLDDWFDFPTTGLPLGMHKITVRVKDANNIWSLVLQDSFQIQTGCGITPILSPTGPLNLCFGDSIQLSTDPNYASYLWSNGDTTASIWVSSSGDYSVQAVDTMGCSGSSFPTTVDVAPQITATIVGQEAFCEGEAVPLWTSESFDAYLWSNGETSDTITISTGGVYSVSVVNSDGCSEDLPGVNVMEITPLPMPEVEQVGSDSLRSNIIGESYIWYRDFMLLPDTTRMILATQSGEYQVSVVNGFGCASDKADPYLFTTTGLEEWIATNSLNLYPNPSTGQFYVEWESKTAHSTKLMVVNMLGQVLWDQTLETRTGMQRHAIQLDGHPSGIYSLILRTPSGQIRKQIVLRSN